ncbi:hypothetical protein PQ455_03440 [Sphingomonas naphthae]|uniref:Uncharacterized protein n=1 Tax=Sphingomonas naphthae TaxID=1813468 RepID=A0ABY7TMW8_9SPHN|nr:hypothetical protein [Sphingomonas naphthae]WCT74295.1 hypothetical protein PQ455_03440 [Sphingomonas naphthae]
MTDKIDEAIAQMAHALALLDADGATLAAANLEHALTLAAMERGRRAAASRRDKGGPVGFTPASRGGPIAA